MATRPAAVARAREVGTYLSLAAASAGLAYGATLLFKKATDGRRGWRGARHAMPASSPAAKAGAAAAAAAEPAAVAADPRLRGLVVVVGVGGVGSHAAHVLTRCGATNLRLVDFDLITLSSLNRHCSAVHTDVGRLKTAVLAEYIRSYTAPGCRVEEIPDTFCRDTADHILRDGAEGTPDKIAYVLDCIDNTETKAELLAQCMARDLPVVSSMGAGSRADPTRVHISNISEVKGDELGRAVRMQLSGATRRSERDAAGADEAPAPEGGSDGAGKEAARDATTGGDLTQVRIPCVWSSEVARAELVALTEEQRRNPDQFGSREGFRLGVVPVLGTTPAVFGAAMAAQCAAAMRGPPVPFMRMPPMTDHLITKITQMLAATERRVSGDKQLPLSVNRHDVEFMISVVWGKADSVTRQKMGQGGSRLLMRWDQALPAARDNLVLVTKVMAEKIMACFKPGRAGGRQPEELEDATSAAGAAGNGDDNGAGTTTGGGTAGSRPCAGHPELPELTEARVAWIEERLALARQWTYQL